MSLSERTHSAEHLVLCCRCYQTRKHTNGCIEEAFITCSPLVSGSAASCCVSGSSRSFFCFFFFTFFGVGASELSSSSLHCSAASKELSFSASFFFFFFSFGVFCHVEKCTKFSWRLTIFTIPEIHRIKQVPDHCYLNLRSPSRSVRLLAQNQVLLCPHFGFSSWSSWVWEF